MNTALVSTPAVSPAICIRGARMHNLRDIDVDIPRDALVVLTGVSGSGKSSLAFDTLFAEGQRRYLESLSAYTRQFLDQLERPDVDLIDGLPPTISIDQRSGAVQPRSTLATTTEIHDFLRLLYARAGTAHCPACGREVTGQSVAEIVRRILSIEERRKVMILAPLVRGRKGRHREVFEQIARDGFVRARVDGEIIDAADPPELSPGRRHTIEAIVDRLVIKPGIDSRLRESVELALRHGAGACLISHEDHSDWHDHLYSEKFACPECGASYPTPEPRMFSFNSPYGACPTCDGLGVVVPDDIAKTCPDCRGGRLNLFASAVTFLNLALPALAALTVDDAAEALRHQIEQERTEGTERRMGGGAEPAATAETTGDTDTRHNVAASGESVLTDGAGFMTPGSLSPEGREVARRVVPEVLGRLGFLRKVGLGYLTLDRPTRTLSGGEFQRARLAGCLGSGLTGVCYILDEPTIGLHPRDTRRLIDTLAALRDQGNTVVVVEHDTDVIRAADWVIDIGPGAGPDGGRVVVIGKPQAIARHADSITGRYLSDLPAQTAHTQKSLFDDHRASITLAGVRTHNLRDLTVEWPLTRLVCVTGVSGSGKSSLVTHSLVPAVRRALAAGADELEQPAPTVGAVRGVSSIARLVEIDQSPLGRSGRSNPATYSGVWDEVRKVFARTREARLRGFTARRFSFNASDGRCETCRGQGIRRIEMHYMPDMFVTCPACRGARFNRGTLAVRFRGRSVADVLAMRFDEAAGFFDQFARLADRLRVFIDVGLGYLTLGQSSLHLSGGEAQRVKLATELSRPGSDRALFVLDEPTTGLHPADVERLLAVLRRLVARGDSVIVIEHQLQLITAAEWLIDLGPDAGASGGQIIATGSPASVAASASGPTAESLRHVRLGVGCTDFKFAGDPA